MNTGEVDESSPTTGSEEWFLGQIEQAEFDVGALIDVLVSTHSGGQVEQAQALSDLLLDALIERGHTIEAARLLAMQAGWQSKNPEYATRCKKDAKRLLADLRDEQVFLHEVGFDKKLGHAEPARRLELLLNLKQGRLCYEKTWGFGVVKDVELFYKRVEIDFDNKPAHEMSLAYAAETLELISEDHILARKHRTPDEINALVKNNPAEVVRISLLSYGPLSILDLQEKLVPKVVEEAKWKRFWDGARKDLKKDPLIEIPTKRTRPIRILSKEKAYDDEWFATLGKKRYLDVILKRIQEFNENAESQELTDAHRDVLIDRLAFVIKGAGLEKPGLMIQAMMAGRRLGLAEQLNVSEKAESFYDPAVLRRTAIELPAKMVRPFFTFLTERDEERTLDLLLEHLPRLEIGTLNEAIDTLMEHGRETECANLVRQVVVDLEAKVEVLNWVVRHPERIEPWRLGDLPGLANQMLAQLDKDYSGERLKAQNQLRERFSRDDCYLAAIDLMSDSQRRDFLLRLKDVSSVPLMDRRSLLGRAIKRHPDLKDLLASKAPAAKAAVPRGPFTSHRSFHQRQLQLQKVVNVDIPQNSKEIGIARSYGDLRENHEFKAAKEMQGILMRRRGELEQMLTKVKPSDFRGFPCELAGIATTVALQYDDGSTEQYVILGEWDRDEDLNIISCETRMAQVLEGRKPGDQATVPGEDGERSCTVESVGGLSDEVLEWIDGEAEVPAELTTEASGSS